MVAMRDDAFAVLGDAAPVFTVDTVTDNPNSFVRRRIEGTFELPLYLTRDGVPGGRLVLDAAGRPQRQPGTFTARYLCNLPPASENSPARMSLYGHGLFGDRGEVNGDLTRKMSADYNIAYCATDWYGMAEEDVGAAVMALLDVSQFPAIPDRIQQGFLAFLYLGRLMKHPQGFSANEAFRFGGESALKIDELYFDGNSQGAILGGALTAVAQDFTRAVLGEAGMNYAVLLDRSVDFDEYLNLAFQPNYPRRYDRIIGIMLAQLLWDRGETNGYANHVTADPLPGTPPHDVLLLGAVGDHQVSRVQPAGRGRHARRCRARARRCPRPGDRARSRLAPHADRVPAPRVGILPLGHRLALLTGRKHPATRGPRPTRRHAKHPRGPRPEGPVLAPRWRPRGRLQRPGLHRADPARERGLNAGASEPSDRPSRPQSPSARLVPYTPRRDRGTLARRHERRVGRVVPERKYTAPLHIARRRARN